MQDDGPVPEDSDGGVLESFSGLVRRLYQIENRIESRGPAGARLCAMPPTLSNLTPPLQLLYTGRVDETRTQEWDWFSAWILFLMLQVVSARLVTTDWAPYLYFTETMAGLGVILGLALGASRFSRRTVGVLAGIYTLFVVPWQLSAAATNDHLLDRLAHIWNILLISLGQFANRQPVKDSLFFVTLVCLAFWLIGLFAGYWFARFGRVLGAVILAGAAIIGVQVYANYQAHGSWWLAVYLLTAIVLVGRAYFLQNRKDWQRRRVFVSDESWSTILGSLLLTGAVAIVVAWVVPVSASGLSSASSWWNTASRPIRDQLSNAVTSLNGPYGRPTDNFYGSSLSIGRSAAQGDSTVFTVDFLQGTASTPRFYWQGRVYDHYSAGQWSVLPASNATFDPKLGDLAIPNEQDRSLVKLQVTSQFRTQTLLYSPAQPVWVDRPATILAFVPQAGQYDTFYWEASSPVPAGGVYVMRAELANPNVQQLEAAGTTYPQWITDRYLQVPESIHDEFKALAEKASAGQASPYDQAAAITDYLRANLQYSDTVPAPPEGQDPIAWVLFDYKKGFCNYYASAEVLMLRSLGIPARMAVGFAEGKVQDGIYVVRNRDAHAWPEVYFPGYGWIEFEPTANQAPLVRPDLAPVLGGAAVNPRVVRPLEGEEGAGPQVTGGPTNTRRAPFFSTLAARSLAGVVLAMALAGLAYLLIRQRVWVQVPMLASRAFQRSGMTAPGWIDSWIRWNQLEPVERSFASINWSLRLLGKSQPMDATPADRARALRQLLPVAAAHITALESEFESGLFTPRPANIARANRASRLILMELMLSRVRVFFGGAGEPDVY